MKDMKISLNVDSYKKQKKNKIGNVENVETLKNSKIKKKNMKKDNSNNSIVKENSKKKIIKNNGKLITELVNATENNKKHISNTGFYIKNKDVENKMNGDIKDEEELYNDNKDEIKSIDENRILLIKKLQEIELKINNSNEWIEKLDVISSEHFYMKKINLFGNCEEREEEFLQIANKNIVDALKKLQDLNISFNRPYDFLADMIKSDIHMEKVREKILKDHEKVEMREKNKLKRINKKFNKKCGSIKVQQQKEASEKKKNLEKIDELKKSNNLKNLNVQEFFLKHIKSNDNNNNNKNNKNKKVSKKWSKNNFSKKKNDDKTLRKSKNKKKKKFKKRKQ